jgi:hypothetical protein
MVSLLPAVIAFAKSPLTPAMGFAALVLGISEADNSTMVALASVVGGGGLIILGWFARSVSRVMEKWLDTQGEKILDFPTKEQRAAAAAERADEKRALAKTLGDFADAADRERVAMAEFREKLAATLANHGARIDGLERRQRATGEILRGGE